MEKFDFSILGTDAPKATTEKSEKDARHLGEVALNDGPIVIRGLIKALGNGPLTIKGMTAKKDFEKASLVLATALLSGGRMTAEKIRAIEVLSRSKGEDKGRKRQGDKAYDKFRDKDPDTGGDGFNVRLLRWMLKQIGEFPSLEGDSPEMVAKIKAAIEEEDKEKAAKADTAKASKATGKADKPQGSKKATGKK